MWLAFETSFFFGPSADLSIKMSESTAFLDSDERSLREQKPEVLKECRHVAGISKWGAVQEAKQLKLIILP